MDERREGGDPLGTSRPSLLRRSLPARLTVAFLGLSVTVLALSSLVSYRMSETALRERVVERLNAVADDDARFVDDWLERQRRAVGFAAATSGVAAPISRDREANSAALDAVRETVLSAAEVRLVRVPGGEVIASTDRSAIGTFAIDELYYQRGQDSTFTQSIYPHPMTGRPTLTISTPVRERGRVIAVLAAHLDLEYVDRVLAARHGAYRIEAFLVNPHFQFLSAERFTVSAGRRGAHSKGIDSAVAGRGGSGPYVDHNGRQVIGAWRSLPELGVGLIVEASRDQAYEPARRLLLASGVVGLTAILVLTLGVVAITRRATRPILAIAAAAERVAEGDFAHTAPVESEDEVGRLADRFNAMTARLRELVKQLNAQVATTTQALREAEASRSLLQDLSDNTNALVAVVDLEGNVRLANARLERTLGVARGGLLGVHLAERLPSDAAERLVPALEAVAKGAAGQEFEVTLTTAAESHLWQATVVQLRDATDAPYAVGLLATDLTERARAEEERRQFDATVQQAQKLESLGIMAGGIAHDFNNILSAVLGNADLALTSLDDRDEVREALQQIAAAARRASDLTRQMLAYAGKASMRREVIDIRPVLKDMVALVRAAQSKKVSITVDPMHESLWVEIDPAQLAQVALNLLTNAAEAIGDGIGTVRLACARITGADGPMVHLTVEDDGAGMGAEVQQRIFEPFFSTKSSGRGLGLSAVMGIIRGCGGTLELKSAPGIGTRFEIRLACAVPPDEAASARRTSDGARQAGTVLVIDDEEALRRVCRRALESQGYRVLEAEDGIAGLAAFEANNGRIALVVLDLTMPGLGGVEVLARIRAKSPDLPVIIASGYSQEDDVSLADDPKLRYLQKPFGIKLLIRQVGELLQS